MNYIESKRRWFKAFNFLTELFVANNESQDKNLTNVEKSIFKLQHTVNYLNCGSDEEQRKYLLEKLLRNQVNHEEFVMTVLMPLLQTKVDQKGQTKKRKSVFLLNELEKLQSMVSGEYYFKK